ncbi:type IV toxin-antitoxin system AbiEi family antitoxin domain-containing protein [Jatrophihabitans sp. YIM 134969]
MFTSSEAYSAGWTPSALNRAVASGRLLRLRRGVYVENGLDGDLHPADRARRHRARCSIAAALVTDGSTVTGLSAATARGWPTWAPRELACLTVTDSRSTSLPGVHLHRTGLRASARLQVAGFAITTPTRTVVDVAREHGTEAGLVVADAAMAAGLTSPDQLREEVGRFIGRRGVGRARPLADLVDPKAESVLESRSRWQFVVHRLPMPQSQVWLYDVEGHFLGRTDFWWADGVIGEVDGAEKLTDPEARTAYLRRQHLLHREHLRVVRWGVRDLGAFDPTAAWLRRELTAARSDARPRLWVASPRRLGSEFAVRALLAANSDPSRGLRGA